MRRILKCGVSQRRDPHILLNSPNLRHPIYETCRRQRVQTYEENPSLIGKTGDFDVVETIWEFFIFITRFLERDASFLENERNLECLKRILQDSIDIDPRRVNHQRSHYFYSQINKLLGYDQFLKYIKGERKLLCGILRLYCFKPFPLESQTKNLVFEKTHQVFSENLQEKTFLDLLGKLLEVFESKMKNPGVNFENAFREFDVEKQEERNIEFLQDKQQVLKMSDRDSTKVVSSAYIQRISKFLEQLPKVITKDLKEKFRLLQKRFMRASFSPLLLFGFDEISLSAYQASIQKGLENNDDKGSVSIFEGLLLSIIDVCKEFKFHEFSVISGLDKKKLEKMVVRVSMHGFLREGDIPEDLTYEEAALISLLITLKTFEGRNTKYSKIPPQNIKTLEKLFKQATVFVVQVQNNILKSVIAEIVDEHGKDLEMFTKHWKALIDGECFGLNIWCNIFDYFLKNQNLKSFVENAFKLLFENLDLYVLEKEKDLSSTLTGILYNNLRLNEYVNSSGISESLWANVLTSPEILEKLLKVELDLLEQSSLCCRDLIAPSLCCLEKLFERGAEIHTQEENLKKNCFGTEEKRLLKIIISFLERFSQKQVVTSRKDEKLIGKNLAAIFNWFDKLYKLIPEEQDKIEIQKYIDARVECLKHDYSGDLKELLSLGKSEYWTKLLKKSYKNFLIYLANQSGSTLNLRERLTKEAETIEIDIIPDSQPENKIYQLDLLSKNLAHYFIKDIIGSEFSLSKDFIEGLLVVTKETLQSLPSAKEIECREFSETVGDLISFVSKLTTNYIVSHVLENNCFDDKSFGRISLEFIESILSAQQSILHDLRRDIFFESNSCYAATVCLMNAILRANKGLRVEFMNRNILEKLLTAERLSALKSEEGNLIMCLTTTLLEQKSETTKNVSPVAEQCVQVLVRSLIENYSFEPTSIASYEKVQEKEEFNKAEETKRKITLKGNDYLITEAVEDKEKLDYDPNFYLGGISPVAIQKETCSLVVVLSGVLSNYPHLIPSIMFQEFPVILKQFQNDPNIMRFFKSNSRMSVFEILLRLVLLKDGSSAVFFIASLIEDNVFLTKIFEILKDILDCEESQGQVLETASSLIMRTNIAFIISFISNEINKDSPHKEEIVQLIIQICQRLLCNPKMMAFTLQDGEYYYPIIRTLGDIVEQNMSQAMKSKDMKNNYASFLKVLETRQKKEPNIFDASWKDSFEKNLFLKEKDVNNKIDYEDQKKFEMWEEKEETKKVLEIAGLVDKELVKEINLAVDARTNIAGDVTLKNIFSENGKTQVYKRFYQIYNSMIEKKVNFEEGNSKVGYLIAKLNESKVLQDYEKQIPQTFGQFVDSEYFLPLFKADLSKLDKLKENKSSNLKNLEENILQEPEIDIGYEEKISQQFEFEEFKESENPAKVSEQTEENATIFFKYFMNPFVKNEGNFKFRVNQALKQGNRLKEMICLEKVLKANSNENEKIFQQFIHGMKEFDRNVVYASLGKKFKAGLKAELQKIADEARAELLVIQKDFSQYEKAKNLIPKPDEQEEEASEYDELDYEIKFLVEDEEKKGSETDDDEEEEIIVEDDEKILEMIESFEVDDAFIMNACHLFLSDLNSNSDYADNMVFMKKLIKGMSLNPANELKIIDTLITVLYTPEFFENTSGKDQYRELFNPFGEHNVAIGTILSYLAECFEAKEKSYVFFIPKEYLNKFGNSLLEDLKETTNFTQKTSDCQTVLDMILGAIERKEICTNGQWIGRLLEGVCLLLNREKDIRVEEDMPQAPLEKYKKIISCKKLLNLLNLIEYPEARDSVLMITKVQEIFMNLKSEMFAVLQDYLSTYLYQTIAKANEGLDNSLKLFKQSVFGETEIQALKASFYLPQLQLIMTILFSFASIFHQNLSTEKLRKSEPSKKFKAFLRTMTASLFNEDEIKSFFVSTYELLELLDKVQVQRRPDLEAMLCLICLGHQSIIIIRESLGEDRPNTSELRKQTGGSSLSDVEQMPSLARLVSFEDHENQETARLHRSYSQYRKEVNVDFGTLFANFALKYSKQISTILTSKIEGLQGLDRVISIIIPSFPWIIDFQTKLKSFEEQINKHLEKHVPELSSNWRILKVDRESLVFSTLKPFKECKKEDLLRFTKIEFKDEAGQDGGGLLRGFYDSLSKELFDPSVGLFKLDENKISIQPNPMSGMIPYDSTLMQFAGLILAKAISERMVLDLNFAKPFLKHILGKKITIGDMEGVDADLGKNLRWILENNIEDLYLTYTHEIEVLGERTVVELKEGGSDIFVDEANKKEYVKDICEYRMKKHIEKQLKAFLKGFRMILPKDIISHFSTSEFEIVISGESKIDLAEIKKHATYVNFQKTDLPIVWFWEVLEEFSQDKLTIFYNFISGSTKVRFGGFKENPVRIVQVAADLNSLPVAHTCGFTVDLPPYETKDKLREKLLMAIFDGAEGFNIG